MKKIVITMLAICFSSLIDAQLNDCPEPANAIHMGDPIPVDFIPTNFATDIWGTPFFDGDRLIIWVHGLSGQGDDAGGTEISWLKASTQTDLDYKVSSRRPDYNDAGIFEAADELKSDMEIEYGDDVDERTFIIAHSQGGIVSRRVDLAYETGELGFEPRTFYGLVTFGSPHQGALIINNIDQFEPWVLDGCDDLGDGPIAEFETTTIWGEILSDFIDLEGFSDFVCYGIFDEILKRVSEDLMAPIGSDYAVGAEELNSLNEFLPTIPYVCFYGEETEPLMWNTIVHVLDGHLPNDFDPFMANNDETLTNDVNNLTNEYYSKYIEWDEQADYWSNILDDWGDLLCLLTPFPLLCLGADAAVEMEEAETNSDAWKRGYDWLENANPTWKSIMGADQYDVSDVPFCQCLFFDGPEEDEIIYEMAPGEECGMDGADECNTLISYDLVQKPSDGVVLKESAADCPGMNYVKIMNDSNHFSMRNDHNTRDRLTELLNGTFGYFFQTDNR